MTGGGRATTWRRMVCLWPLLYLAMLVVQPAFDPETGPFQWAVAIGAAAAFVPLFVLAEFRDGAVRRWSPLLSTALGIVVFPVNSYAGVFFIYAAAFAGSHLSRRVSTRWLVGLTALLGVVAAVYPVDFPWRFFVFAPALLFVWVVGLASVESADRRRAAAELRVEHARAGHLATLTERERISRDLHDLLGQTLTGIVVRSQLAQRLTTTDPAAGAAEMAGVERVARAALTEVRATVAGWRHVDVDEELAVSREALDAAGVELVVTRDSDLDLTPSTETALALALREAVTNVVRHSRAGRCSVTLGRRGDEVVLQVSDDGVGGEARDGTGLTGMRERIVALGGDVRRQVRDGTALTVAVPAA
jgi:two-component system, NarL family, sensor histidine kinase DesK